MSKRKTAYKNGVWAEKAASLYLMGKGYRIVNTRYKAPVGEIDIIAVRKDTLVFIEVKARKDMDNALESVTARTRKRIENAAGHFLSMHPQYNDYAMRFDVIAIQLGLDFSLRHLDNAWQCHT